MEPSTNAHEGIRCADDMRNVWTEQSNQVWKQLQYSPMKWPQLHFDKLEYPSKSLITLCGSSNEEWFMSFSSALTHRSVWRDEGFCTGTHWTRKLGSNSCIIWDVTAVLAVSGLVCAYITTVADLICSSSCSDRECEVMGFERAQTLCISDH